MTVGDPKRYERLMSLILRFGVITSSALMASGLLIATLQTTSVAMPEHSPTLGDLVRHVVYGRPGAPGGSFAVSLMFAGLVVLMLTPFLRVATTLAIFRAEKDWKFVGIAALVFLLLAGQVIYSLY